MSNEVTGLLPGRQQDILRRAMTHKIVRIKDLAAELGVHEMTVRRDLDALCEQGKLQRVHGGAQLLERTAEELSQTLRAGQNVEAKERIARAARPGDHVLCMSNGGFGGIHDKLLAALAERAARS